MSNSKAFSVRLPDTLLKGVEIVAANLDVSRNQAIHILLGQRLEQIVNDLKAAKKITEIIERTENISVDKKGRDNILELIWSQIKHNEDQTTVVSEKQVLESITFEALVEDEEGIDQELTRSLDELRVRGGK
jgi:metal-responsive CopG/Arc/MetJ family transcriptional regulator